LDTRATPSGCGLIQERISSLFWKAGCTIVRRNALNYRPNTT